MVLYLLGCKMQAKSTKQDLGISQVFFQSFQLALPCFLHMYGRWESPPLSGVRTLAPALLQPLRASLNIENNRLYSRLRFQWFQNKKLSHYKKNTDGIECRLKHFPKISHITQTNCTEKIFRLREQWLTKELRPQARKDNKVGHIELDLWCLKKSNKSETSVLTRKQR